MTIGDIMDMIVTSRVKKTVMVCTVNAGSVDIANRICDVTSLDGQQFFNVRLVTNGNISAGTTNPLGSGSSLQFMIVPADGSQVIVQSISEHDHYITQYSTIAKMMVGDGSLGGMVEVIQLTTKLNNLENLLNKIVNAINAWTPVAGDGGAALRTLLLAGGAPVALTPTVRANLENTTFTQGI